MIEKLKKAALLIFLAVIVVSAAGAQAGALEKDTLELINKAVFEVIIPKPTVDSLTYEKPLPMDLLPFTIRNDKYHSVGTAFAISPSQLVTAAHVFMPVANTQMKDIFVRDKDGNVYKIDKVIKFSGRRDFAVFTLMNKSFQHYFQLEPNPQVNQKVFAVGNALGQGVVIRDGLYTSDTPEEISGEWKWMRFSAAASPGNSGGPLLNEGGRAIGLVLGKSKNENLNTALSVREIINSKDNTALAYWKLKYILDNTDMSKTKTYSNEFALPMTYGELHGHLNRALASFSAQMLKELTEENRETIFPRGPGSVRLLHSSFGSVFPGLVTKDSDGTWTAMSPREKRDADLGNNGQIKYGVLGHTVFIYILKPDNISTAQFYQDSKLFMDLILKGLPLHRYVGSEKVKIISMGKAASEYMHKDLYGRQWVVREWLSEYDDRKYVTFSLPVPGGFAVMMRDGQTGQVDTGHIQDLKYLSDFIYVSYYGSLKQWKDYLGMKDILPESFTDIDISAKYGELFTYKSKRFSVSYRKNLININENSDLMLKFTYFRDKARVVWDVQSIVFGEDKNSKKSFYISRHMKPAAELSDKYQEMWKRLKKQEFPYNKSSYFDDKMTIIVGRYASGQDTGGKETVDPDIYYSVAYSADGNVEQKKMMDALTEISGAVKVSEDLSAGLR
jgi:serine protease Do